MCGKTSTTTSSNSPPAQVLQQYGTVTGQANQVASTPYQAYTGQLTAGINPTQAQATGNIAQQYGNLGGISNNIDAASSSAGVIGGDYQQLAAGALNTLGGVAQGQENTAAGIGSLGNVYQPYYNQAQNYTSAGANALSPQNYAANVNQYLNPYTQDVVNTTEGQFNNQNAIQASSALGSAIASGNAFGGDRAGVAQGILAGQQQTAEAPVIAGLESAGYTNAQGELNTAAANDLTAGAQYGTLGTGAQAAALAAPEAQVAAETAAGNTLNQAYTTSGNLKAGELSAVGVQNQASALQQANDQLGVSDANSLLAAGTLGQQTSQAALNAAYQQFQNQIAFPYQQTGWLGNISEGIGTNSGGTTTTTSPAPFFSDERLKQDKTIIGKTKDGQDLYRFRYKGDPHWLIGLMAQDVAKKHPEAVSEHGGYLAVDYKAATDDAARTKKAIGGGIGQAADGPTSIPGEDVSSLIPNESPLAVSGNMSMPGRSGGAQSAAPMQQTAQALQQANTAISFGKNVMPGISALFPAAVLAARGGAIPHRLLRRAAGGRAGFADGGSTFGDLSDAVQLDPAMPTWPGGSVGPVAAASPTPLGLGSAGSIVAPANSNAPAFAPDAPQGSLGGAPQIAPTVSPGTLASTSSAPWFPGGSGGSLGNAPAGGLTIDPYGNAIDPATGRPTSPVPAGPSSGAPMLPGGNLGAASSSAASPSPLAGLDPNARGMRNNNPGNLEDNSWTQSLPGYTGTDGRFAKFDTPQHGLSALDQNLQSYGAKGVNTPLTIASKWAPGSEAGNDPVSYGSVIARNLGVGLNDPIDMTDPAVRSKITGAIAQVENGSATGATAGYAPPSGTLGSAAGVRAIDAAAPRGSLGGANDNGPASAISGGLGNLGAMVGNALKDPNMASAVIKGIFAMLASPSHTLAGAIGSGGVAGVDQYNTSALNNSTIAKNTLGILQTRFTPTVGADGKVMYFDNVGGGFVNAQQRGQIAQQMLSNPAAPLVTVAPTQALQTAQAGAGVTSPAPTAAAAGRPAVGPTVNSTAAAPAAAPDDPVARAQAAADANQTVARYSAQRDQAYAQAAQLDQLAQRNTGINEQAAQRYATQANSLRAQGDHWGALATGYRDQLVKPALDAATTTAQENARANAPIGQSEVARNNTIMTPGGPIDRVTLQPLQIGQPASGAAQPTSAASTGPGFSVPVPSVPKPASYYAEGPNKVYMAQAEKDVEGATSAGQSAMQAKALLGELQNDYKDIPPDSFLASGAGGSWRQSFAKTANEIASLTGTKLQFDPNAVASNEQVNKLVTQLGVSVNKGLGREPGYILEKLSAMQPGLENTPQGNNLIMAGLRATNQSAQDYADFMQRYMATNGHTIGAQAAFNKAMPENRYIKEAETIAAIPQNHVAALRNDPTLAAKFDQQYGPGMSRYYLQ